ncbi:MAG TPA: alpha/beta hydrolase [Candidatus Competibacter sp.]|nr:alpha/beta hydrolase [Candidatus Competibacter sp.]
MPVARLPTVSLNYLRFPSRTDTPPGGDLVLVHGLAASLGFWHLGIVRPLSWLCRLTAYDLRGHGRSELPATGYSIPRMADDLAALLDHLGLERVHLLGHSFGGAIALLFAHRHPERVRSVIVADTRLRALQPYHRLRDWSDWPHWRPILRRAGIELNDSEPEGGYELLVAMARAQTGEASALPLPLFPPSTGGARRNGSAHRWLRLQEVTSIKQDLQAPDGLVPQVLQEIRLPVLGLYGENSPVMPTARALRRLCPHYDLHLIRHAGHFFPLTRPRRLAHATLRFLAAQTGLPIRLEQIIDGIDHDREPQPLFAAF